MKGDEIIKNPVPPVRKDGTHATDLPDTEIGQHTSWCDGHLVARPTATVHGYQITIVGCTCGGHFHAHHPVTGLFSCVTTGWTGDYQPSVVHDGMQRALSDWVALHVIPTVEASVTDLEAQDALAHVTRTGPGLPATVDFPKQRLN